MVTVKINDKRFSLKKPVCMSCGEALTQGTYIVPMESEIWYQYLDKDPQIRRYENSGYVQYDADTVSLLFCSAMCARKVGSGRIHVRPGAGKTISRP